MSVHDEALAAARTVAEIFAIHVQRDASAPAVLTPDRPTLDYGTLAGHVDRTARALARLGLGRGKRVAVLLRNGPRMAIAMLALLSSRAACSPLNPALDENASRTLLAAMRVNAVIVDAGDASALRKAAEALGLQILEMLAPDGADAAPFENIPGCRTPAVIEPAEPDDLALLMATSGTTGPPKVVPVSQYELLASMRRQIDAIEVTSADRCLCVTPLFTTSGIRRNLLNMLLVGGSMVCVPAFRAEDFVDWVRTLRPTHYSAGPAVHRAVLQHHERGGPIGTTSMRFVLSGATSLPVDVEKRLEAFLGVPVLQGLGMSEAGLVACNRLPPGVRRTGSVGLPAGVDVVIHDESGRTLAPGESGEVVIRGPGVIRGYEENPEANRDAFRDGWFRTGDLGFFGADGYLYLTGRVKELINRGGFKVSPFEVDTALLGHPDVVEAATFAVPHATLGEDVNTAVVVKSGSSITARALRDFAFGELAPYKVPTQIVVVQALPKTALGKVSRHELAARFGEALRVHFEPPRNAREEEVARLFAAVLGLPAIGVFDNFFHLGGDSLRGAQVIAQLNAEHRSRLTPPVLFRRPTAAEFAAELDAAAEPGPQPPLPPIVPRRRVSPSNSRTSPTSGDET